MSNISKINLYCQKLKLEPPQYQLLKKYGEDHHPTFQVCCILEGRSEIGHGSSLKLAKEEAALKIVEMLNIDLKLRGLEDNISYSIYSYNAPLSDIWNDWIEKEYILTLRKKQNNQIEYKNFKVKIIQTLDDQI